MIVKKRIQHAIVIDRQGDSGVFDTMNDAIKAAHTACEEFSEYSRSRKNVIIDVVIKELESHLEELSLMTIKENGINTYDDIIYKNTLALNNIKNHKHIEARLDGNNKVNNCEDSHIINGVICQSINPIETIIKNSILMLKAGNTVVFSSNKNVKHVFAYVIKLINNAIESAKGPKNLIVTVKEPSTENTNIMIEHEKVTLISEIYTQDVDKIAL